MRLGGPGASGKRGMKLGLGGGGERSYGSDLRLRSPGRGEGGHTKRERVLWEFKHDGENVNEWKQKFISM